MESRDISTILSGPFSNLGYAVGRGCSYDFRHNRENIKKDTRTATIRNAKGGRICCVITPQRKSHDLAIDVAEAICTRLNERDALIKRLKDEIGKNSAEGTIAECLKTILSETVK